MIVSRSPLLFLLVAAALAGPPKEADPKTDPAFNKAVDESIAKGVAWLLTKQSATGRFPSFGDSRGEVYPLGMHALSTLTIIKGGSPVDGKPVQKALRSLRGLYADQRNNLRTYEVGVLLMMLDAKYTTPQKSKKKKKPKKKKLKVDAADLKMANELALWLQTKQKPSGLWRYPEGGEDISNTQYAALGLWSAKRLGLKINAGVVRRMLEGTLAHQAPKGARVPFILDPQLYKKKPERRSSSTIEAKGWRYLKDPERIEGADGKVRERISPYSGSMTSAGVAILAIGRDILGKKDTWLTKARDRQIRTAMWQGLAWLQSNWDLADNPGQPGNWPFYWIYGLERCARLSGVEFIGRHDWFYEGAQRLIPDQRTDGAWPKNQRMKPPGGGNERWWSDQVDTCFAILFLKKATVPVTTK